ncbi:MAG: hypothetical protein AABX03_01180 [Nanoarchaeota archaeon]
MKKEKIAFILMVVLILFAGTFAVFLFSKGRSDVNNLTQSICQSGGGHWNSCGNKCSLLYPQGNPNYACTKECQSLCECGGIAGFACPNGYTCIMPSQTNISDALGYCEKI